MLRDISTFLIALLHEWVVVLTGGAIIAVLQAWDLSTKAVPSSVKLVVLVLTCLVATFRAWRKEYRDRRKLSREFSGYPRLLPVPDALEKGTFRATVTVTSNTGVATFQGPDWSVIRFRIVNDPLDPEEESVAKQVRATLKFYSASGDRLFELDGRWSDSPQPSQRDESQDIINILAVDFPIGQKRSLDIAFKDKTKDDCYGVNNDSYLFPDLKNPAWKLPYGTIVVVASLTGIRVKCTAQLQFENSKGTELEPVKWGMRNELESYS